MVLGGARVGYTPPPAGYCRTRAGAVGVVAVGMWGMWRHAC